MVDSVNLSKYALYTGSFLIGFGFTRTEDGGWIVSGLGLLFLSILISNMNEFEPGGRLSGEVMDSDKITFFDHKKLNDKLGELADGASLILIILAILGFIIAFFSFVPLVPALLIIIIILLVFR